MNYYVGFQVTYWSNGIYIFVDGLCQSIKRNNLSANKDYKQTVTYRLFLWGYWFVGWNIFGYWRRESKVEIASIVRDALHWRCFGGNSWCGFLLTCRASKRELWHVGYREGKICLQVGNNHLKNRTNCKPSIMPEKAKDFKLLLVL